MTTARLQATLDQLLATSAQRWLLVVVSLASIVTPSVGIIVATPFADTWLGFVVLFLGLVVASEPNEQLGLVLVGIIVLHWIVLDAPVASLAAVGIALCLYVFHVTVALMAVTPHSATIEREVFARLVQRSLIVVASTIGVWLLVVVFEARDAKGSPVLLAVAFAVLAGAVAVFRSLSLFDRGER